MTMEIIKVNTTDPVHLTYGIFAIAEDGNRRYLVIQDDAQYSTVLIPSNWAELPPNIKEKYLDALDAEKPQGDSITLVFSKGTQKLAFFKSQLELEEFQVFYKSSEADAVYCSHEGQTFVNKGTGWRLFSSAIPSGYVRFQSQSQSQATLRLFGSKGGSATPSDLRKTLLKAFYSRLMRAAEVAEYKTETLRLQHRTNPIKVRCIAI